MQIFNLVSKRQWELLQTFSCFTLEDKNKYNANIVDTTKIALEYLWRPRVFNVKKYCVALYLIETDEI